MSPHGEHRGTVLIVDDETYVRDSLTEVLARKGFRMRAAASVAAALEDLDGLDAVVTDLKMPGAGGDALVRRVAELRPELPVLVLTGHGTVASAVECMKAGAFDYLLKPADPEALALLLARAIGQSCLRRELDYLRSGAESRPGPPSSQESPLGEAEAWRRALELARVAAPTDTTVLLLGESGTGKGELASFLHRHSPRARRAFVQVNCAAVPVELFESEFFGHRRGAFTGAHADREGRFRVADGGTLLLDEIDALPPVAQAKILRVIQDGTFERVGDSRPTHVDVRLLCASNADLEASVQAGRFRADLYYRISVLSIPLPPLRQRPGDVALLARAFLEEFSARQGKAVRRIHPDALAALERYPWPGNVRELRNVLERGVLLQQGEELTPDHLPFTLASASLPRSEGGELNLKRALAATERRTLEEALERAGGVRQRAAELLGIDARNLAYYLRKHGLMEGGRS